MRAIGIYHVVMLSSDVSNRRRAGCVQYFCRVKMGRVQQLHVWIVRFAGSAK